MEKKRTKAEPLDRYSSSAGIVFLCVDPLVGAATTKQLLSPETRPPNQEVYPYSDALYYNLAAESVTIGEGLSQYSVTPRPFYLTILAYLVHVSGGDYARIIQLQTWILALIPVFIYLIGKKLTSRAVGFSLGLLATFRELVAIQATADIQLSNSKLIMADLPTLLVLLLLCYLLIDWLKSKPASALKALGVGGCLGGLMLLRTQAVILLPFILAMFWWQNRTAFRRCVTQTLILVAALVLITSPWLVRNYVLTNQLVFDDPTTQTSLLQGRYQVEGLEDGAGGSIITAIIRQPVAVFRFVANHFLRNEIGTVLVTLPQRWIGDWSLLYQQSSFWRSDTVVLNLTQTISLVIILILLALGIAASTSRWGIIGLVPLIINLAYTLGNGLARNSGGRYNLPVDWVGYFYITLGIFQLFYWCGLVLRIGQ